MIYNLNSPLQDKVFKVLARSVKFTGLTGVGVAAYCRVPGDADYITQFYHTKTLLGRGFDYVNANLIVKIKGDVIAGNLGKETMLEAVAKYAPDSKIVDADTLEKIKADKVYSEKLRKNMSFSEMNITGVKLVDPSTLNS